MNLSALFCLFCFASPLFAAEATISVKKSSVEFLAIGSPGFLKIHGTGGKAEGKLAVKDGKASGELTCQLSDFDTGIALRNEHMRDKYLEVKKHPKAVLKVDSLSVSEGENDLTGTLFIKGVGKPAKGKYTVKGSTLKAEMNVKVSDYPIGVPSYLGVTMAEDVKVTVDAEFE